MTKDPWFPKQYTLTKDVILKGLLYSGKKWQIYSTLEKQKVLISEKELANEWINKGILKKNCLKSCQFGLNEYFYIVSEERYVLQPLGFKEKVRNVSKAEGISFATALRLTREIVPDVSLEDAIFVEKYSRILPTFETVGSSNDDSTLVGTYLSGGISLPITASRSIATLSKDMEENDVEQIANLANVTGQKKVSQTKEHIDKKKQISKKFSLPGSKYLENFFVENVIDIVQHLDRYEKLGISFPLPIILYGLPGSGKTYSVEKLAEFLDWPLYSINSATIGSPYIHQTGKKISEIFEKAFLTAPSIIVIDEMEAFLSKRDISMDHKVEEVDEFLRLIPKAVEKRVLVIGTTNMIEALDPAAIRTGRFDRKIEVKMPQKEDIKAMIDEQVRSLPIQKKVDFTQVIEQLAGHPRSDVTFVIKEAARLTAFKGKEKISQQEIDEALEKLPRDEERQRNPIGFAP